LNFEWQRGYSYILLKLKILKYFHNFEENEYCLDIQRLFDNGSIPPVYSYFKKYFCLKNYYL